MQHVVQNQRHVCSKRYKNDKCEVCFIYFLLIRMEDRLVIYLLAQGLFTENIS